jgi:3-hydroxyacyl-CoA dehydrogenase
MGPLALADMTGLDILVSTDRVTSRAFGRHGSLSPAALGLVDGRHPGQKTGSGVYKHEKGDYTPHENPAAGSWPSRTSWPSDGESDSRRVRVCKNRPARRIDIGF